MLKTKRPGFSIKDDFVVHPSRNLKYGGEVFEQGKAFPWKKVGCTPRRLQLLFEARKIITAEELEATFERAKRFEAESEVTAEKEGTEVSAPRKTRRPKRAKSAGSTSDEGTKRRRRKPQS